MGSVPLYSRNGAIDSPRGDLRQFADQHSAEILASSSPAVPFMGWLIVDSGQTYSVSDLQYYLSKCGYMMGGYAIEGSTPENYNLHYKDPAVAPFVDAIAAYNATWNVRVITVQDAYSSLISGATVRVIDASGATVFSGTTNSNGYIVGNLGILNGPYTIETQYNSKTQTDTNSLNFDSAIFDNTKITFNPPDEHPQQFTLSLSSANGTVSKNPNQTTFEQGTNVILTATPNQGYKFTNWSQDASGSSNPLTLAMTSDKTVTANFTKSQESEQKPEQKTESKEIIPPTTQFSKDIKLKDIDQDTVRLQQFLNSNGFTVSTTGYGSKGYETIYFGPATQAALNKFQTQYLSQIGISSPTGYLDSKTRAFINLKVKTTTTAPISSSIPSTFKFSSTLKYGQNSNDILYLQKILNSDPATRIAKTGVGSWGKETIHFGPATRAAIIKFQEKYAKEILAPLSLTRGTGTVGQATIKKLNSLVEGRNY
jgi:hypothetical protein